MKRDVEKDLLEWKNWPGRMPLLLRGARQVGKTYIVENFGKEHFDSFVEINLERDHNLFPYFESLDPRKILSALEIYTGKQIIPGRTLVFFDEIQECPKAIMALRYFKEEIPELHVIGAGSLLEFVLSDQDFRMPVGRVQFLYLRPLSFGEFLDASENHLLRAYLQKVTLESPVEELFHNQLTLLLREYLALGGMPSVLNEYFAERSWQRCQEIQSHLLTTYRNDFGKYARHTQHRYLQVLFEKAPGLISQWFKYSKIDPEVPSRYFKEAVQQLSDAGLISQVFATSATGIPFAATMNEKKFKILFLDVGLVKRACRLEMDLLLEGDLMLINQGALVEQFVGQEMRAYANRYESSPLFFWCRERKSASAEVDYVISIDSNIIPVEVKSGTTGRLKSLRIFIEEKQCRLGIRVSGKRLSFENRILSIPLYLVSEIKRIVLAHIKTP